MLANLKGLQFQYWWTEAPYPGRNLFPIKLSVISAHCAGPYQDGFYVTGIIWYFLKALVPTAASTSQTEKPEYIFVITHHDVLGLLPVLWSTLSFYLRLKYQTNFILKIYYQSLYIIVDMKYNQKPCMAAKMLGKEKSLWQQIMIHQNSK